ncbi:PREDICTED: uncharacterized protein LOC108569731 [Nicrophorus vespilloides]|uniref:Uncharacterized protein LOC108569731 n=1 Tax=Nicrophorus vespilloides TaxID=110193 RepID=A0ABM1NJ83_NICVS|nr:PREDICTED: uncharacterized protein LOC108569731 [Nicrophorus vespilloides]
MRDMLQPRNIFLLTAVLLLIASIQGDGDIESSPRQRRQSGQDVTTVLLVDSHGRSTFGRFLSVKPDVGLLTSTARTFIQEGVTTEYATQVLGTTLDNGRLYAHLLTKSSRVLYDNDSPTRSYNDKKKWNIDQNLIDKGNFVKNTDYISPNQVDKPFVVFPTTKPDLYKYKETFSEEELLSQSSNNARVPFAKDSDRNQNNVKVFQIHPQKHIDLIRKEENDEINVISKDDIEASKVKEWDNLPTFTVRNEFSPSGFSFLGDLPEYDVNTEKSKPTTAADRKAKLLFRGGIPNKQDLKTVTYTGFADFTTTVGDTVIVFTPQTEEPLKEINNQVTKIKGEATLIEPQIATKLKTFLTHEPGIATKTVEGHKLTMQTLLPTMVIDAATRKAKNEQLDKYHVEDQTEMEDEAEAVTEAETESETQAETETEAEDEAEIDEDEEQEDEEHEDNEAKLSVLFEEQKPTPVLTTIETTETATIKFTDDIIQSSETQLPPMLSRPSEEEISKFFNILQQQEAQKETQPLNTASTIFYDEEPSTMKEAFGGATTIFFEDEPTLIAQTTESQEEYATTTEEEEEEEEILERQTTENAVAHTTHKEPETTTHEEPTTTTTTTAKTTTTEREEEVTTQEQQEEPATEAQPTENEEECADGQKIVPVTLLKTLTYVTTYFIPLETNNVESTSTSVKFNEVVSTETTFNTIDCTVLPSIVDTTIIPSEIITTTTEEITTTESEPTTTEQLTTTEALETTPFEITTERRHVTESEPETTELTTDSGEEIELLFKTLYTTYTYLTTFFQESTSSISSRKVVVTNVITSTIEPGMEMSDDAVKGLVSGGDFKTKAVSFEDFEISPSAVGIGSATNLPVLNEEQENAVEATPALSDDLVNTAIKTYYTTYTYFTTIFVDGETEISSRTEVYTNFVTPTQAVEEIKPTVTVRFGDDEGIITDDESLLKSKIQALNISPDNAYNSTINRQKSENENIILDNNILQSKNYHAIEGTTTDSNDLLDLSEYETISTMVTDVRSSTSEGDKRVINENSNGEGNVLLDDQIVSESNNESEIIPSPTLLLQTSYTTFTYFTTMYQGTTASNVVSRLETVTNVVTETLTPTKSLSVEDLTLPITYYTTYTYWTTLYKDGTTKITNREETVSNIVSPTETAKIEPTVLNDLIKPTQVDGEDLTTFYTTFTYFTTAYNGSSSVINSRLETVTNILNKTEEIESNHIARAIGQANANKIEEEKPKPTEILPSIRPTGLLSTIASTVENEGIKTILSTDVYGTYIDGLYAKVLESTEIIVTPTVAPSEKLKPTGVVSINQGKVVDVDGISTLFYTTQAVGTYISNLYAQVIESTSSLVVDEEKKALQTDTPATQRTGLVRLIDGSIIHSDTTIVYQSKVLGTLIDGTYAHIIESTSSFITKSAEPVITPTATVLEEITPTALPIAPSPVVIEGSISDSSKVEEDDTESPEEEEETSTEDGDNTRVKSRLTFSSRKRTFTPVIRPFASRPKPTFAPKRKGSKPSATTITRSDFTPTVTAIPASKSRGFGNNRKSSSSIQPASASGSRRFTRPKSSTFASNIGPSSTYSPNRGRSSGRVQPSSAFGSSSRRSGFRSSTLSSSIPRPSSAYNGNNRFRIRPTLASTLSRGLNTVTVPSVVSDEENDLTTQVTDNPEDLEATTTESSSRRSQNPLLKFRRPPIARPPTTPRSLKGSKNTKKVTTTAKPAARSLFNRPSSNSIQNRARPNNGLFPRRNLFTTTTPPPEPEEEEEEEEDLAEDIDYGDRDDEDDDTEYESSVNDEQTEVAPEQARNGRAFSPIQIRPFAGLKRRSKRETALDAFTQIQIREKRQSFSRFRRPGLQRTTTTTEAPPPPETEAPKKRGRFAPKPRIHERARTEHTRNEHTTQRIAPSRPTHGRSQFTLRDTNSRSSFKRPSTEGSRIRKPTPRPSSRSRSQTESNSRPKTTSRARPKSPRRGTTASRQRANNQNNQENETNFVLPKSDGTITVTHQIPIEVTIPVVNGKITEYRNVVTAQLSTEVLTPKQYSTTTNPYGKDITVLLSESTGFGANGATQITKYTLNESPTTTVIFTPTTIRGRRTSFSHVIPSTVYVVEPVVNTIAPPPLAQGPLANILLSQLLLGNNPIQQQPNLLGLQNQVVAGTPTTEYKTRTTTYVTTVTSETSTVIPLTFRGKEILTTIIDSSVNVITATEFLTETVVVTPTPLLQQNNQLNSLLVPFLLQQQQQQQQQQVFQQPNIFQSPAGVLNLNNEELFKQSLFAAQDKQNLAIEDEAIERYQTVDDVTEPPKRKSSRKKNKKPTPSPPPKETSVITLYVSGRTPGEFSTILSTVVVGEDNRKKREASYIPVEPSRVIPQIILTTLDQHLMPAIGDFDFPQASIPTESLENVIDVSKQFVTESPYIRPTKAKIAINQSSGNFLALEEYLGQPSDIPKNYHRKRIIVKKRKNRRRVVVTKKRILNPSTKLNEDEGVVVKPTRRVRVRKIKHTISPISQTFASTTETYFSSSEFSTNHSESFKDLASTDDFNSLENKLDNINNKNKDNDDKDINENKNIDDEDVDDDDTDIKDEDEMEEDKVSEASGIEHMQEVVTPPVSVDSEEDLEDETQTANFIDLDSSTETHKFFEDSEENLITNKSLPEYEPFFPEISESIDASGLLAKTTVITAVETITKTTLQSKLRTYTFVVTRVSGDEQVITSTTEVKPHTKTVTITEPTTRYTTLTLLDLDATETIPFIPMTVTPSMESSKEPSIQDDRGRALEEARYNLATRVMSNGVELIVAGDKSTLPGDYRRVLPNTQKAVTLKPSTVSNNMMMVIPTNIESLSSSLYPNQFVTKTCLTTFTYLTTYLDNGTTTVSSHEQVVSNIATEERNTGKILATPTMGITLTQYPKLEVGTFVTTYTYLNTILDGEQPLVVTSKKVVTNTVTAPDDYLSLFRSNEEPIKHTNTYYSTIGLEKTLYEGQISKVVSTNEVVTQVVITESVPVKATATMTSYIAVDKPQESETVKTYFVTYTYNETLVDNGNTVTNRRVVTSSDVVTEKLFLQPKSIINSAPIANKKKNEALNIYATKTYFTTFTYLTTLETVRDNNTSTVINSHSKIVENIVTESVDHQQFDKKVLNSLKKEVKEGGTSITKVVTLNNGQKLEITAVPKIKPTKVLPIEKTKMPEISSSTPVIESSKPNVITGSTIIFVDDDPFAQSTPSIKTKSKNALNSLLSSEIVKQTKRKVAPTKSSSAKAEGSTKRKPGTNKVAKPAAAASPVSSLLGSINIQALTPVLNAMAGLIQHNLKAPRRNDTVVTTTTPRVEVVENEVQNRSPIYIPVGGLTDIETAESENIAVSWHDMKNLIGKSTHESPLLTGGIPISPGEIITTNSDVIVGKPGRIGPRIPAIPLINPDASTINPQDIQGMKPPPAPVSWLKRYTEQPSVNHASNNDYEGSPPKIPIRGANLVRNNKPQHTIPFLKNSEIDLIVRPSQILLPEVIERSTGQPLLVNIQPSQVAFVNIPHNRTTALIYGGSTEPHVNGQYFDDPSPYPQPEFSAIEAFNNGVPQFASVYNQKEVGGVIKVATHSMPISEIRPSRPLIHIESHVNNHDINVDVPPLSFSLMNQGNDFSGHIINHADVQLPSLPFNIDKHANQHRPRPPLPDLKDYLIPPPMQGAYNRPSIPINLDDIGDHTDDDLPNEAGEVIQESNSRPLIPGQVPFEVLKANATNYAQENEIINFKPNIEQPRPFDRRSTTPPPLTNEVYPEHRITNQAKPVHHTPRPQPNFIKFPSEPRPINRIKPNEEINRPTVPFGVRIKPMDIPYQRPIPTSNNNMGVLRYPPNNQYVHRYPERPSISHGNVQTRYPPHGNQQFTNTKNNNYGSYTIPPTVFNGTYPTSLFTIAPSIYNPGGNLFTVPSNPDNKFQQHPQVNRIKLNQGEVQRPTVQFIPNAHEGVPKENEIRRPQVTNEIIIHETTTQRIVPTTNRIPIREGNFKKPQPPVNNIKPNDNAGLIISHEFSNYVKPIVSQHVVKEPTNNVNPGVVLQPRPPIVQNVFGSRIEGNIHLQTTSNKKPTVSQGSSNKEVYVRESHVPNTVVQRPEVVAKPIQVQPNLVANHSTITKGKLPEVIETYRKPIRVINNKGVGVSSEIKVSNASSAGGIVVRPENQQTNQINHKESNVIIQPGPNIYANVFEYTRPPPTSERKRYSTTRPRITSLPIDTKPKPGPNPSSQTEQPFNRVYTKSTSNYFGTQNVVINSTPKYKLNIGEIESINEHFANTTMYDIEIMKPPPPIVPEVNMVPPKVEVLTPTDLETQANTPRPYLQGINEVIGMKPPVKPNYSIEMHPPKPVPTQAVRIRRPSTRRTTESPLTKLQTYWDQTVPTTTPTITNKPKVTIHYPEVKRNRTTPNYFEITRKPYLEVRRNNTKLQEEVTTTTLKPVRVYTEMNRTKISDNLNTTKIQEVMIKSKFNYTEIVRNKTNVVTTTTEVVEETTTTTTEHTTTTTTEATTPKQIVIEESVKPVVRNEVTPTLKHTPILPTGTVETVELELPVPTTTRRRVVTSIFKRPINAKPIQPTQTSTVTITITTVVKSLGGPPSTITRLITTTVQSNIVDTITEFHTLLKPTTIAETITTTIKPSTSSLYPSDATYGAYPIKPTAVIEPIEPTIIIEGTASSEDELEDFIIRDTDPPIVEEPSNDSESFFVVMNDKNQGSIVKIPKENRETQHRDEMIANNEVNRILSGEIIIAHPPSLDTNIIISDKCLPECKPSRNELCQRVEGVMRCVCRPGFARMFPDRPCKPTYTYTLNIVLDRHGKDKLHYSDSLNDTSSTQFLKLAEATQDGLHRMVMQSDFRDIYHGVSVKKYEPLADSDAVLNIFTLQLSDNTDQTRLEDVFKKYLRNNNYSLGGTDVYASKEVLNHLRAEDFDECSDSRFHDCSEHSQCFNLRGTYTCSCREGFADLSENMLYPGRICSAELIGCEKCHYHGTCYTRDDDQILCECFQWYAGDSCQVNLKVLLIALVTLGAILFTLLMICIVITCAKRKPKQNPMSFLPQRVPVRRGSTIDRRAMIQDSSSESGHSDTLPYVPKKAPIKGALKKPKYEDQKDRSLTVMIPRAKYHPAPPTSPQVNKNSNFEKRKMSAGSSNEAKLLSYLDAGPSPNKGDQRKFSRASDSYAGSRKTSGALVSAGFEVSATVGPNMGTLGTTCGTEADRSENATLIQKISADLLSSTGTPSQFNTLRKSIADTDEEILENWLDITPRIQTISESRSYDETTIQPPTKTLRSDYDTKSSHHHHDEANTMAERDLGSTFLLPHTHLYKPDRGSDISGFESL